MRTWLSRAWPRKNRHPAVLQLLKLPGLLPHVNETTVWLVRAALVLAQQEAGQADADWLKRIEQTDAKSDPWLRRVLEDGLKGLPLKSPVQKAGRCDCRKAAHGR